MWSQILRLVQRNSCSSPYYFTYSKNFRKIAFHNVNRDVFIKTNKQEPVNLNGKLQHQLFHSSPVCSVPVSPLFWIVLKPISKLFALITGRGFRKWWQSLPPNKKQYFIHATKRNRWKIIGVLSLTSGIVVVYYYTHLQETPYTKRKRFMIFTPEQFKPIADLDFKLQFEENKSDMLPKTHPVCKKIVTIANQILHANKHIKELYDKNWSISVIDKNIQNAFAFPNGQIFVFTGLLKLCENNDQLGIILAHEMAHCILGHAAESFNYSQILDLALVVVITAIWAVMPSDIIAFISHWFTDKAVEISLSLPYNRKLEIEADEFGLELAAKACFDIRESSALWAKLAVLEDGENEDFPIKWLSTHPSNEARVSFLESIMHKNIMFRKDCGCPDLPSRDPRSSIFQLKKISEKKVNLNDIRS